MLCFICLFNVCWLLLLLLVFQVDCMEEALQLSQENSHAPDLKVSVLLDYTRGSRGRWRFLWRFSVSAGLYRAPRSSRWSFSAVIFNVQGRLTRGPCCCHCCSASPHRCGCLCITLRTWGGCWGCWSLSASTRLSESSISKFTSLTTALSSAGMLIPAHTHTHRD